jgi:DNA modification methylase
MDIKVIKSDNFRYQTYENILIHGDCLEVMDKLPSDTYDMVFIDPPYFLQLPKRKLKRWEVKTEVNGVEEAWDKFESFEDYDRFVVEVLSRVKRLMKETATLWVIGTYHNIYRWGKIMQDMGFWILNDVIWLKSNPMPNWLGVRFTNSTETLLWVVKDKKSKGYTFNKEWAKTFGIGKVYENVWKIPICSRTERVKDEQGLKVHPTQKPIELLKRIILTSTEEGDLILDPMAGVGTTGITAYMLGRKFTLIEKEEKYIKWTIERFRDLSLSSLLDEAKNEKTIRL